MIQNKRGQMFLIAALLIVVIITSVYSIKVFVKTYKENTRPSELVDEIEFEGISTIDYGVYNDLTDEETTKNIETLVSHWIEANDNSEIRILIGNQEKYTITTGRWEKFTVGSGLERFEPVVESTTTSCETPCDKVTIITELLPEIEYPFELTDKGKNLYVVVVKIEDNGEITVATNKNN